MPETATLSAPSPLIVPAMTPSPPFFGTGLDSPVTIDSFTSDSPSITAPSAGIFARGGREPCRFASVQQGNEFRFFIRITSAVSGRSFESSFSAPCAPLTARISSQ